MRVLLTGGAGYIGAHTAVELIGAGHDVSILDNFANSSPAVIDRIRELTGMAPRLFEVDLLERDAVQSVFTTATFDAVIHFAGLKAVGESVADPLRYYRTNLTGTLNLLDCMVSSGTTQLVFSSSATVYGDDVSPPISENSPIHDAASPYGRTKLMIERMLEDVVRAQDMFTVVSLRYFNPAGAHASGEMGEDPTGIPNNLMPYITQVAVGERERLTINGNDYPTPDGTCIRDYIHVTDLARGHLAALDWLSGSNGNGLRAYNLGTGRGTSVLEMVDAFERANGLEIPRVIGPRRPGDIPASFTDPARAEAELGWRAVKTVEDICRDAWRWQQKHPRGFEG